MGITSIRAVCVARCRLYWHCKITHWGANGSHIAPSTRPTLQINAKPPSLSCTSPGIVLSYITFNVMCFTFDKPVGATRALVCSYVPTSPLHARHASGALQYRGKNQWVEEAKTAASSRTKIDRIIGRHGRVSSYWLLSDASLPRNILSKFCYIYIHRVFIFSFLLVICRVSCCCVLRILPPFSTNKHATFSVVDWRR